MDRLQYFRLKIDEVQDHWGICNKMTISGNRLKLTALVLVLVPVLIIDMITWTPKTGIGCQKLQLLHSQSQWWRNFLTVLYAEWQYRNAALVVWQCHILHQLRHHLKSQTSNVNSDSWHLHKMPFGKKRLFPSFRISWNPQLIPITTFLVPPLCFALTLFTFTFIFVYPTYLNCPCNFLSSGTRFLAHFHHRCVPFPFQAPFHVLMFSFPLSLVSLRSFILCLSFARTPSFRFETGF